MTTEPCPTCKGVCCVNKYGNPADHGSALALRAEVFAAIRAALAEVEAAS